MVNKAAGAAPPVNTSWVMKSDCSSSGAATAFLKNSSVHDMCGVIWQSANIVLCILVYHWVKFHNVTLDTVSHHAIVGGPNPKTTILRSIIMMHPLLGQVLTSPIP